MYYIIWVEGLSLAKGEKVYKLVEFGCDYTTKMTEALRIRPKDLNVVEAHLKRHGISYTVHRTNYAPAGTIFKAERYQL